ncbi:hypothetical protein JXB41_06765 [Candidatus Woesearchaeota archaeon]|nr:hypothetical protein [Candidatus Woesearchaeota archaeon]
MSKQILVKTLGNTQQTIKNIFNEIVPYLEYFGFKKHPIINASNKGGNYQGILFKYDEESIFLEYVSRSNEEAIKLNFYPLRVNVIYDVLLMRINQIAKLQREQVFIHKIG